MLEHTSSSAGFVGMLLIVVMFAAFSLLRVWCFTDAIWKLFNRQRD
ncbi:hypothetical protein [Sporomusa sp. GT1]|nr:hypothetical protein [Sporomusa sp. GT1]